MGVKPIAMTSMSAYALAAVLLFCLSSDAAPPISDSASDAVVPETALLAAKKKPAAREPAPAEEPARKKTGSTRTSTSRRTGTKKRPGRFFWFGRKKRTSEMLQEHLRS